MTADQKKRWNVFDQRLSAQISGKLLFLIAD
jgi:hypothetical protein